MKKIFCYILFGTVLVQLFGKVENELRERIYVQTDKNFYLAGEQILLKFLTTTPNKIPINFSKVAYAELTNDSIAQIQIMVELKEGTGIGKMLLPANMPTGNYRLIAYTQFMRNESEDVFFEKNIAVLNTFQSGYYLAETEPTSEQEPVHHKEKEFDKIEKGIVLQSDKTTYSTRTNGEIIVNGLPENIYTLSVSITGKELLDINESNETLFQKILTKKSTDFSSEFLPEYEGHIVLGKIIDNENNDDENKTSLKSGISFPGEGIRFFAGQTVGTEEVRFFTSAISGTKEIASVIYGTDDRYRIDIQSPFVTRFNQRAMPALQIDSSYYGLLLDRSVELQMFRYFADNTSENNTISEPYFKMKPTHRYKLDDYTRFTTMREVFTEFIAGARFRRRDGKQEISVLSKIGNTYSYGTMPLVVIDGVPISDHEAIFNYDPLKVENINTYYGPIAMGGYMFDGIVELTTYNRQYEDLNLNRATQILSYEGPQSFYNYETPDYSKEENRKIRKPDTRHTLLWKPDIKTNGNNNITVPFDTSDLTGEFQVTVEGITTDGKFFSETLFFIVE